MDTGSDFEPRDPKHHYGSLIELKQGSDGLSPILFSLCIWDLRKGQMSESMKREVTQGGKRGSWAVANVLTNGLGHRRKRAEESD